MSTSRTRGDGAAPTPLLLGLDRGADGGSIRYLADLRVALGGDPPVVEVDRERTLPHRLGQAARAAVRGARHADLVDCHFALYAWTPLLHPALRRLPLVVHMQGPWADEVGGRGAGHALRRAIERSVYGQADRVVTLSQAFAAVAVERYGIAPWNLDVIPPAVDLGRFSPGDRRGARTSLGLADEDLVAVTARRLVPRTGVDLLVDAWPAVRDRFGDRARLLIAGDGSERARLEAQTRADPTISMLGRVTDSTLVELYRAADLSVVPSRGLEGYGLVVLESLACGTPVVGTDVDGLAEAVGGLDPSAVTAPEPSAIAARVAAALDGSAPLASPEACRAHAERHGPDRLALAHRELYASVVDPRRDRRRVAFIDHSALLSGGEIALTRLIAAMPAVEAHALLFEDGPLRPELTAVGATVEVAPLGERARSTPRSDLVRPWRLLRAGAQALRGLWSVYRRLGRLRPDLVHVNSLKAGVVGGIAARLRGIPVVWHVRDRIAPDYLPRGAVGLVRAAIWRVASAVIVVSEATARTVASRGIEAHVVNDPLSSDHLRPPGAQGGSTSPGGSGAGLRLLCVGRFASWKGQDVVVRALGQMAEVEGVRLGFVGRDLFGEDDYERQVRDLASHLGLEARVHFYGARDDVATLLRESDVLVHASVLPEPFGQAVAEGLAAGLAVVAADAGGPAELIEDGVEGLLVPPGDPRALASVLDRLARSPALRHRLGEAGRRRAESLRPELIGPEVEAVYEAVLADRS